jgi:hypothetical protein
LKNPSLFKKASTEVNSVFVTGVKPETEREDKKVKLESELQVLNAPRGIYCYLSKQTIKHIMTSQKHDQVPFVQFVANKNDQMQQDKLLRQRLIQRRNQKKIIEAMDMERNERDSRFIRETELKQSNLNYYYGEFIQQRLKPESDVLTFEEFT